MKLSEVISIMKEYIETVGDVDVPITIEIPKPIVETSVGPEKLGNRGVFRTIREERKITVVIPMVPDEVVDMIGVISRQQTVNRVTYYQR